MTVPGRRPERVGELIREEVSALLVSGLKDPRIGFATITAVRVTPDLRAARVYVSVMGTPEEQQQTLDGFRAAQAYIRSELAHRLNMRRMPELSFEQDRTAEQGARIDELLRRARSDSER